MARDEIFWEVEWAGSKVDHSLEQLTSWMKAGVMATDMNYREPGWAFSNTPRWAEWVQSQKTWDPRTDSEWDEDYIIWSPGRKNQTNVVQQKVIHYC